MVYLIHGASHTGKTVLAQQILEKYKISYLSIDHLKMGLIRSGLTTLTPSDDDKMTDFIWPIVREIIKTAIENNQNLTIEGCYIPFNWRESFAAIYQSRIKSICLIMSKEYIYNYFSDIKLHANEIEKRLDDSAFNQNDCLEENTYNLHMCMEHGCPYWMISGKYDIDLEQIFKDR